MVRNTEEFVATSKEVRELTELPAFRGVEVWARQLKSGWRAYAVYWFSGYSDHDVYGNPAGQMLHARWRVVRNMASMKPLWAQSLEALVDVVKYAAEHGAVYYGDADASEKGW